MAVGWNKYMNREKTKTNREKTKTNESGQNKGAANNNHDQDFLMDQINGVSREVLAAIDRVYTDQ